MKRERVDEQKRMEEDSKERSRVGRPKKWTDERIQEEADALNEWIDKKLNDKHLDPTTVIWVKDFAIERRFSTQRLSEWAASHEGFSEVFARAKEIQESQLANGALLRFYDPGFTKFVLVNHHKENWADKTQTELMGPNNGPIQIDVNNLRRRCADNARELFDGVQGAGDIALGVDRDGDDTGTDTE